MALVARSACVREGRVQEGIGRVSGAFPRETRAEPDRALGPAGSGFPSRARRAAARETRRGIRARSAARFAGAIRTLAETQEAVAVAAILCALTRTTGVVQMRMRQRQRAELG